MLNNHKKRLSEKLELLPRGVRLYGLLAVEQLDGAELLVGDAEHADVAVLWEERPYAADVRLGVLHAGAVAHVDGELEHREAVALQVLAEQGVSLLVALRLGGKVEKHEYPHNPVFAETVGHF